MKNSSFVTLTILLGLGLSLGACGKKKTETTATTASFNEEHTDSSRVDKTPLRTTDTSRSNDGALTTTGTTTTTNSTNNLSPTCFNYMDNFSLAGLRAFFDPGNTSPNLIPHANGDLAFCMEYDNSPDILANMRFEYQYTNASQPGQLNIVRFTTKLFKDANGTILTDNDEINARFYWGEETSNSIELIWMDNAGFVGVTATLVSGDMYSAKANFVNMPSDSDVDDGNGSLSLADVANSADQARCLDGSWSADTCVSSKVFQKSFFEKARDGSQTSSRAARVAEMAKRLLSNSHPTAFANFEIDSQMLGDSMNIDLSDAMAYTISE